MDEWNARESMDTRPTPRGGYPWDRWEGIARSQGISPELATLGRALMRNCRLHRWEPETWEPCGWDDGGEGMLKLASEKPAQARHTWESLLASDGRGSVEEPSPRPRMTAEKLEALHDEWEYERVMDGLRDLDELYGSLTEHGPFRYHLIELEDQIRSLLKSGDSGYSPDIFDLAAEVEDELYDHIEKADNLARLLGKLYEFQSNEDEDEDE
jgi:hypothetical protein